MRATLPLDSTAYSQNVTRTGLPSRFQRRAIPVFVRDRGVTLTLVAGARQGLGATGGFSCEHSRPPHRFSGSSPECLRVGRSRALLHYP
jgi:hypothetical protein